MAKKKIEEVINVSLGIDVGNGYCKVGNSKFASRFTQGALLNVGAAAKEVYSVKHDGVDYLVGVGDTFLGDNRYFTKGYLLTLLTSIYAASGKLSDRIIANICVGLPVELYMADGMKLPKKIKDAYTATSHKITVAGVEVAIHIDTVEVFIEGAYPVLEAIEKRVITLDMGAGTLDVTEFNKLTPTNWKTYDSGMNYFYNKCSDFLKLGNLNYAPEDIEEVLDKEYVIYKGKQVNLDQLKGYLQEKVSGLISSVQQKFEFAKAEEIYLIGGGSAKLSSYLIKAIEEITDNAEIRLIENAQYINSMVYETVIEDITNTEE